jgi:hypothetical protein
MGHKTTSDALTVGLLQMGITLTMVSLVGFGSNKVNSMQYGDNFIKAYHLDEHRGVFGKDLHKQLLSFHPLEADYVSIYLYASPQLLQEGSSWYRCLMTIAKRNFIQLMSLTKRIRLHRMDIHFVQSSVWPCVCYGPSTMQ